MSTVFATQDTLRTQYRDLTFVDITGSNTGTEKLLIITATSSKMFSLTNDSNAEIWVFLENSEDLNHTKIPFLKLGAGQAFTIDAVSGGLLNFPAACRFWIHSGGLAVTSGKVRAFLWG
jgi:hypothetical protein